MPYRRPVSPFALEIYHPPASETAYDEIGASDDDLDEPARAAKRRRIEALADAYLRGTPPLILSASLKGPFGKGWVNPWTKDRRRKGGQFRNLADAPEEIAVEETRPRRRREDDRSRSRAEKSKQQPASSVASPSEMLSARRRPPLKSNDMRSSFSPRCEHVQVPVSTGCGLRRTIPRAEETPLGSTVEKRADCGWLKTDRTRTTFQDTEPPTSPTADVSHRQEYARKASSISFGRRPISDLCPAPRGLPARHARQNGNSQKGSQLSASRASLFAAPFPPAELHPASSLRVVNSCSQLPKFEYRLHKKHETALEAGLTSLKSSDSETRLDPSVPLEEVAPAVDPVEPGQLSLVVPSPAPARPCTAPSATVSDDTKEPDLDSFPRLTAHSRNAQSGHKSSDVDGTTTSHGAEEVASEDLPSGQAVPGNPALSDHMSLHSTALRKDDGCEDRIPGPQFSTQAALLLAHTSFQNGLTSPDLVPLAPDRRQESIAGAATSQSPGFVKPKPFREVTAPGPCSLNSPLANGKHKFQMMSTQCIVDAVTPFTFSTAKKDSQHPNTTTEAEVCHGQTSSEASLHLQPRHDSQSQRLPFSQKHEQFNHPDGAQRQRALLPHHDHETQMSGLPFTLTGETPATAQNGQGGLNALDSFDLSQAIADAGSWLRQSFDLTKDLQHCSEKAAARSTDMHRSALGLHPL